MQVFFLKIKKCFFSNVPKFQRPLSSRGEGGLGLNGPALEYFETKEYAKIFCEIFAKVSIKTKDNFNNIFLKY